MDKKKLLSMAILGTLSATRFTFGMAANLTKASLDSVDEMASYFSGVKTSNTISNTLWNGGQKIATQSMNWLQKSVQKWAEK